MHVQKKAQFSQRFPRLSQFSGTKMAAECFEEQFKSFGEKNGGPTPVRSYAVPNVMPQAAMDVTIAETVSTERKMMKRRMVLKTVGKRSAKPRKNK